MIYEIRRNGVTLCTSPITNAGYSLDTLRSMENAAYTYISAANACAPHLSKPNHMTTKGREENA